MDEVLEFIHKRFPDNNGNWLRGNCFYFSLILAFRFPKGTIWYEPILGHFLFNYKNTFYDWTGVYLGDISKAAPFEEISITDSSYFKRIVRDCIL